VDLKIASAQRRKLTQHDVLGNTATVINFTERCSLEKDFHSFLERATHQSTCLLTIDAMASDCHEIALGGHDIHKTSQMPMIHVRTIEREHHE
jgi:hypothetical protein